jgi:hypothetical protein
MLLDLGVDLCSQSLATIICIYLGFCSLKPRSKNLSARVYAVYLARLAAG